MTKGRARSNWASFSLLNLMALSTIVAVWLPWWIARNEPTRLQTEIDLMNQTLGTLVINDPSEFVAVKLSSYSYSMDTWRIHVPPNANLEACLATEGINNLALPKKFKRFHLPSGQHEISLLVDNNREDGFSFKVFMDGDLELNLHRDTAWLQSGGSSSQGDINKTSTVYDVSKPIEMKRLVFSPMLRVNKNNSIYLEADSMADAKGCYFWLQDINHVAEPAPDWVDETTPVYPKQLGIREGMRLRQQANFWPGLKLVHSKCMSPNEPILTIFMDFESEEADQNLTTLNTNTGEWKFSGKPFEFVQPDLHSSDQSRQSFFLIHETNNKPQISASTLIPIVEVIFDLDYPDEVGFRLVPPNDGIAVDRWKLRAVHHLSQYWKTLVTQGGQWTTDEEPGDIQLADLPEVDFQGAPHRAIEIRSPAEDSIEWDKLNVPRNGRFRSLPQRHSWLVPKTASSENASIGLSFKVLKNTEKSPSSPIPGGPVISELILDIENPDNSIHWYRIDVQPFDE